MANFFAGIIIGALGLLGWQHFFSAEEPKQPAAEATAPAQDSVPEISPDTVK